MRSCSPLLRRALVAVVIVGLLPALGGVASASPSAAAATTGPHLLSYIYYGQTNEHGIKVMDLDAGSTSVVPLPDPEYTGLYTQSLSPDGKLLAVMHDSRLDVVPVAGGTSVTLGQTGGASYPAITRPAWTPDSKFVLWTDVPSGSTYQPSRLVREAADGSGGVLPTPNGADVAGAELNRQGTRYVFRDNRATGAPLSVMNADGSGRRSLGIADAASATWAPDGQRIAFVRGGSDPRVCLVNADGSGLVVLPSTPAGLANAYPEQPVFSTDGGRVLYQLASDIYGIPLDGQGPTKVVGSADFERSPSTAGPEAGPTGGTAPAGVTAAIGSDVGLVDLSWTPPAEALAGYSIWAEPGTLRMTVAGGSTTHATFGGLTPGTPYRFFVSGINGLGAGLPDQPSNAVDPTGPPTVPRLSVSPRSRGLSLTWLPPLDDGGSPVTSYEVVVAAAGITHQLPASARADTISGLTNGQTYVATVRALRAAGSTETSRSALVKGASRLTVVQYPPSRISRGESTAVRVRLTDPELPGNPPVPGQRVELWPYLYSAYGTTNSNGEVTLPLKPGINTDYRVSYSGSATQSSDPNEPAFRVLVRAMVISKIATAKTTLGRPVLISGRTNYSNTRIYLQEWANHAWRNVRAFATASNTSFATSVQPRRGSHAYRVLMPDQGQNIAGAGQTLNVTVT